MDPLFSITCTTCHARLAVRDAAVVDQILSCPKCGSMIQVEPPPDWEPPAAAGDEALEGGGDPSATNGEGNSRKADSEGDPTQRFEHGWASYAERRLQRLLMAGALSASVVLAAFGAWRYLGGPSQPSDLADVASQAPERSGAARPPSVSDSQPSDEPGPNEEPTSKGAGARHADEPNAAVPAERAGEAIYRPILRGFGVYEASEGTFPPGTKGPRELVPTARLSWLASLLDYYGHSDWRRELEFDRPWNDEPNRSVARRQLELVINPLLDVTKNEAGYAVTHFVGLAGWGADAAELDPHHPRAGVFGYNRRFSLDQVADGSANTIAIMGVRGGLGPWAQGGPATVRALTREPYVDGPDGFGTGQADGMFVGMLDGSVRFISKEVDPSVLRELATAGGRQRAGLAAGESSPTANPPMEDVPPRATAEASPTTDDAAATSAPAAGKTPATEHEPAVEVEAEAAPPEPVRPQIDLAARLADRVPAIDFSDVRLTDFLEFISQLSTIPITLDVDRLASLGLAADVAVSVQMSNAAVEEILLEALSPTGLTYEIVEGQLFISVAPQRRDALSTVRYRVVDLAASDDRPLETFAELVRRLVAPGRWGEGPAEGKIRIDGDSLVVRQTEAVHEILLVFCEKLRMARGRPLRGGSRSDSIRPETLGAAARDVLDLPIEATFFEPTRLARIVDFLERTAEVEILVDWLSLWTEGVYHDATSTLRCHGCPLEKALETITEPLELTYRVVDERTFQITTRTADAARPVFEIHSIAELVAQGRSADALLGRLQESLADGENDSAAAAAIELDAASSSLLVLDSQRSQRRIEQLLSQWQSQAGGQP